MLNPTPIYRKPNDTDWQIRQLMRHLIEVMLVVEGKEGWTRRLAERRREQGLPLPSVEFIHGKWE